MRYVQAKGKLRRKGCSKPKEHHALGHKSEKLFSDSLKPTDVDQSQERRGGGGSPGGLEVGNRTQRTALEDKPVATFRAFLRYLEVLQSHSSVL